QRSLGTSFRPQKLSQPGIIGAVPPVSRDRLDPAGTWMQNIATPHRFTIPRAHWVPRIPQAQTGGEGGTMLISFCATYRLYALIGCITLGILGASLPNTVAAASGDVPSLWDPKRRPDKPDVRSLRQIRFLTEDDYPPFNFTGASGQLEGFNVDV